MRPIKKSAWVEPCQIVYFRDEPQLHPQDLLFVDNRPELDVYEGQLSALSDQLKRGREQELLKELLQLDRGLAEQRASEKLLSHIFGAQFTEAKDWGLSELFDSGVSNGLFRDTVKVSQWLGIINYYGNLPSNGVPRLRLKIAHAKSEISRVRREVAQNLPAGVILSGSPYMLSEVIDTPVIQRTVNFTKYLLREEIPVLGICFGMHLLAMAQYDTLVDWLVTPPGQNWEIHTRVSDIKGFPPFSPCVPDARRMIFGSRTVKLAKAGKGHPIMLLAKDFPAIKVHSQGLIYPDHPGIPNEDVLAFSTRWFTGENPTKKQRYRHGQSVVEVLRASDKAYGTQLHPELEPELLYAMTWVPPYVELLLRDGYNLSVLREELKRHPDSYFAGQRIGYNWVKRILAPDYFLRNANSESWAGVLVERLDRRNKDYRA